MSEINEGNEQERIGMRGNRLGLFFFMTSYKHLRVPDIL